MKVSQLHEQIDKIRESANTILADSETLKEMTKAIAKKGGAETLDPFIIGLTVFILACFVGYYVVWKVTPALHSPLMSVTNAISSVIIVGAVLATGTASSPTAMVFGFIAVVLASINIFGGFIVTQRMLQMFSKSK